MLEGVLQRCGKAKSTQVTGLARNTWKKYDENDGNMMNYVENMKEYVEGSETWKNFKNYPGV